MNVRDLLFLFSSSSGEIVNPNIALGDTLLTQNTITKAYWDFTNIDGDNWDVLTAHSDSSINGTYNLVNFSSTTNFLPSLGFFNIGENVVSTLRARTSSGIYNAFVTSPVATGLGNGEREFHFLFTLQDGMAGVGNRLGGLEPNNNLGTMVTRIESNGKLYFKYGYSNSFNCTYLSNSAVIANGSTDIHILRVRMTTTSVSFMLDGVNVPCSLSAGVDISTLTLSNYTSAIEYAVGGSLGNDNNIKRFVSDLGDYKYILKHAITGLLTDAQYLQLVASFLNL